MASKCKSRCVVFRRRPPLLPLLLRFIPSPLLFDLSVLSLSQKSKKKRTEEKEWKTKAQMDERRKSSTKRLFALLEIKKIILQSCRCSRPPRMKVSPDFSFRYICTPPKGDRPQETKRQMRRSTAERSLFSCLRAHAIEEEDPLGGTLNMD